MEILPQEMTSRVWGADLRRSRSKLRGLLFREVAAASTKGQEDNQDLQRSHHTSVELLTWARLSRGRMPQTVGPVLTLILHWNDCELCS